MYCCCFLKTSWCYPVFGMSSSGLPINIKQKQILVLSFRKSIIGNW